MDNRSVKLFLMDCIYIMLGDSSIIMFCLTIDYGSEEKPEMREPSRFPVKGLAMNVPFDPGNQPEDDGGN